jgi:hypothetical protein
MEKKEIILTISFLRRLPPLSQFLMIITKRCFHFPQRNFFLTYVIWSRPSLRAGGSAGHVHIQSRHALWVGQNYPRKNLTSSSKSANRLSTSCVRTACPKLSTTLLILSDLLQGCSNKCDTVMI